MTEVRLWFLRGMFLILAAFLSSALVWSSDEGSHMPPLMNSNSNTVNLEVTYFYHALKLVEWKEEDLPPVKEPVKCMIVGKDHFGFRDRLSFVFAESGVNIAGRPIEFVSLGSMDKALQLTKTDSTVMLLVALESVAGEWGPNQFPSARFSCLRSKCKILEKRGDVLLKFDSQPGQAGQPPESPLLRFDARFQIIAVQKIFQVVNGTASGLKKIDFDYSKDAVRKDTSLSFAPFEDETLNLRRDPGFFFSKHRKKGFDPDISFPVSL